MFWPSTYPSSQGLAEGLPHRRIVDDPDARHFLLLLRARTPHLGREQQTAAPDQSNELTAWYVEHGELPLPDAY
jgi:hypothetical protein